jgi:hypothetical protein
MLSRGSASGASVRHARKHPAGRRRPRSANTRARAATHLRHHARKSRSTIETLLPKTIERFPVVRPHRHGAGWSARVARKLGRAAAPRCCSPTRALADRDLVPGDFVNAAAGVGGRGRPAPRLARPRKHVHRASHRARHGPASDDALEGAGVIRCVVCTSSLDLGVDFSPVARVIQVGSPKGIARLMQRAGRSGHSPGQVIAALLRADQCASSSSSLPAPGMRSSENRIEARPPLRQAPRCAGPAPRHRLRSASPPLPGPCAMKSAPPSPTATSTDEEWEWALDFITRGGATCCATTRTTARIARRCDGKVTVTDQIG